MLQLPVSDTHSNPINLFRYLANVFDKTIEYAEDEEKNKFYYFVYRKCNKEILTQIESALSLLNNFCDINANKNIGCEIDYVKISLIVSNNDKNNYSLCVKNIKQNVEYKYSKNNGYKLKENSETIVEKIYFNDNFKVWYQLPYKKGYPCSLKKLFSFQNKKSCIFDVVYQIFLYWSKENIFWKDIANDFYNGSGCCPIPLPLVQSCHNKKELIEKYCGNSLNRNNRENIGKGLFLALAKNYVYEKHYQFLFDFDIPPFSFKKNKNSLSYFFYIFIYSELQKIDEDMILTFKNPVQTLHINKEYVKEVVTMALELKKPLKIKFTSLKSFFKYYNELALEYRVKEAKAVKIPRDSVFNKLNLSKNFIRLKTKKDFIEESAFQNSQIISSIYSVNNDYTSIWSYRVNNKERYTLEIFYNKKTNKFILSHIKGRFNSIPSSKIINFVKKEINKQNRILKLQKSTNTLALSILDVIKKYPMSKQRLDIEKYIKSTFLNKEKIDAKKLKELLKELKYAANINKQQYLQITEFINKI